MEKEKAKISYDPRDHLTLAQVKELDEKYLLDTYARMPVHFIYGSGEFLYDSEGKEYIDFLSGIAVTGLGHAHADLIETLTHQGDKLWHSSNLFYNQEQALLARALIEITFPGKVFFCNSGTEANEAAIKLMRAWGVQNSKNESKSKIIALKDSFHGRTFGSMSITGQDKIQKGFGKLLDDIIFIEPNDIAALEKVMDNDVCGVIMEPIMGEGGVIPLEFPFLEAARNLCNENKAILVFDEVQSGIGRTGQYFAYQVFGIQPDVLTIAKGLGAGFPIGAMVVSESFTDVLKSGSHGSTFGGNHLGTALGYEVLRLIESGNLLKNVQSMSSYLVELLEAVKKEYPKIIKEIRGIGLLIGIVLDEKIKARPLVKKALEHQLVIGRAGENIIRLAPPLNVRQTTIEKAVAKLEDIFREI